MFAEIPTYPFTGFAHPVSISDTEDLAYLAAKVSDLGRELFVRDVSFLGFPAFQVYVPGMSETDFIFEEDEFSNWMEIVSNHSTLLNLKRADAESIAKLAKAISKTCGNALPVAFEPRRWFLSNTRQELQRLSRDFLMTLLFSRNGDFGAAAEKMDAFIHSEAAQSGPMRYYKAVGDYLKARKDGRSEEQIKTALNETYGEVLTLQVLNDFSAPESVLDCLPFPSCFDCGTRW